MCKSPLSMSLSSSMLATPENLFDRLTPVPGIKIEKNFKKAVSRLYRPYYRLSEDDHLKIDALATTHDTDVFMLDLEVMVTFGTADLGFALMPIRYNDEACE